MSNLAEVNKTGELKDGALKDISFNGHEKILAGAGDKYYAADKHCPENAIINETTRATNPTPELEDSSDTHSKLV